MANERSYFDIKMQEMFNPFRENYHNYHASPWPGKRTQYDQDLQKTWCPNCGNKQHRLVENYNSPPWPGQRTEYDQKLQQEWCPNCGSQHKDYKPYGK